MLGLGLEGGGMLGPIEAEELDVVGLEGRIGPGAGAFWALGCDCPVVGP